jgi:hypothetical protein
MTWTIYERPDFTNNTQRQNPSNFSKSELLRFMGTTNSLPSLPLVSSESEAKEHEIGLSKSKW